MLEPTELVEFRKQWKQELSSDIHDEVPHAKSTTSQTKYVDDKVNAVDKRNYSDRTLSSGCASQLTQVKSDDDTEQTDGRTLPKSTKRSWDGVANIREQSNVLQPFLIAENLLKGESGLDSLVGARRPGPSTTTPSTASTSLCSGGISKADSTRDKRPVKRQKTQASESDKSTFLDLFLNDLDEINEIPFFELDLPREVAIKIFCFLDITDLCRCSQVSTAWKSLADDELLWSCISHKLGNDTTLTTTDKHGWKTAVKEHVIREKSLQQNWKNRMGNVEELQHVTGGVLCAVSSHKHLIVAGYNSCQLKIWDRQELDSWTLQPSTTALVLDERVDIGIVNNYVSTIGVNDHITAAGYNQGFVDVWSNGGKTSPFHSFTCSDPVSALCCSKSEPLLVVAYNNCVRVEGQRCSGDSWSCIDVADFEEKVSQLMLQPGSNTLVTAVLSDSVYVYPACTGHGHMTAVYDVIGHPVSCVDGDGTDLAVGISAYDDLSNVYKLKLFDVATSRESMTFRGHHWRITTVNMADNTNPTFVTGCADKIVRVFDRRLPDPVICFNGHSRPLTGVQMDDWKVVSGAEDGLLCVWDQRMVAKLWDVHNRHPVRYKHFEDNLLVWGNIPQEKCPETDGTDNMVQRRYRGSLHVYDFALTQDTDHIPEICQSMYDVPETYNYNIRLAVPYDNL